MPRSAPDRSGGICHRRLTPDQRRSVYESTWLVCRESADVRCVVGLKAHCRANTNCRKSRHGQDAHATSPQGVAILAMICHRRADAILPAGPYAVVSFCLNVGWAPPQCYATRYDTNLREIHPSIVTAVAHRNTDDSDFLPAGNPRAKT